MRIFFIFSFVILLGIGSAQASECSPSSTDQGMQKFFISAVLRKKSEGDGKVTIKLVHSVEPAQSREAAVAKFLYTVTKQYRTYSVATILVSAPNQGQAEINVQTRPGMSI